MLQLGPFATANIVSATGRLTGSPRSRPFFAAAERAGEIIGRCLDPFDPDASANPRDRWCYTVYSLFCRDRLGQFATSRDPLGEFTLEDEDYTPHKVNVSRYRLSGTIAQVSVAVLTRLMQLPLINRGTDAWRICRALTDGETRTQQQVLEKLPSGKTLNSQLKGTFSSMVKSGLLEKRMRPHRKGYRLTFWGRWAFALGKETSGLTCVR